MRRIRMILFSISLISMFILTACGSSQTSLGTSGEKEKFVVGLEAAYAPFNWTQRIPLF